MAIQAQEVGTLINMRSWEIDGNAGTTINVMIPIADSKKSSDFIGYNVVKMTGSNLLFSQIDPLLCGEKVTVDVELVAAAGGGYKPVPHAVKKFKA